MKKNSLIHITFIGSFFFPFIGTLLKLKDYSSLSNSFLILGIVFILFFLVLALIEINKSQKLNEKQKTLWTIGLLIFVGISPLIYYFIGRKNI